MTEVRKAPNLRRACRRPFQCTMQISWHTRTGEVRSARAKCLDISPEGACLECIQPVEARTNVYVQAPSHGLMGDASVRYCVRSGMKYHIGLLFSSASRLADQGRQLCLRESQAVSRVIAYEN
jgi:hypothetical protein